MQRVPGPGDWGRVVFLGTGKSRWLEVEVR